MLRSRTSALWRCLRLPHGAGMVEGVPCRFSAALTPVPASSFSSSSVSSSRQHKGESVPEIPGTSDVVTQAKSVTKRTPQEDKMPLRTGDTSATSSVSTTSLVTTTASASTTAPNEPKSMRERVKKALLFSPGAVPRNWKAKLKKLLRYDENVWIDRLLSSKLVQGLPAEEWDRFIGQTKNISVELRELKTKQLATKDEMITWLQSKITTIPKVEWEKVRELLRNIPPLYYERFGQVMKGIDPEFRKNIRWVAKVTRFSKKNDKQVALPDVPAPPKYPIILAHGLGGDKPFLKCFLGIPEDLQSVGVKAYTPKVARYGTVYVRAKSLKEQITQVLEETKAPKVNIIGHSMGGLDARYFITNLEGHKVTASLITVGTPHRGSAYGDWIISKTEAIGLEKLFKAQILPFPMEGHHHVASKFMKETFNPQTLDHPDVAYFSLGGSKKISPSHPLYICQRILSRHEGCENDGLVSVESSKWGEYLETLDVDHAAMINWSYRYDARVLYRRLVNLLRERGF